MTGRSTAGGAAVRRRLRGAATLLLPLALTLVGASTGCTATGDPGPTPAAGSSTTAVATAPPSAASASAAPSAGSAGWVGRCTDQVTYWATEVLRGRDAGYDYQEMGLAGTTNDALRAVLTGAAELTSAKGLTGAKGAPSAGWIGRRAARECRVRAGRAAGRDSTVSGWP